MAFGMGTRWILALLPSSWIAAIASNIHLVGSSLDTANNLAQALSRSWVIDGGPPVPIPYAFANGVLNPLTFDWAGASSLPLLAVILLLMLSGRLRLNGSGLLILFSAFLSLALSAEHIFVLVNLGVGFAFLVMIARRQIALRKIMSSFGGQVLAVVVIAAVLSLVQGGVITELARTYIQGDSRRRGDLFGEFFCAVAAGFFRQPFWEFIPDGLEVSDRYPGGMRADPAFIPNRIIPLEWRC